MISNGLPGCPYRMMSYTDTDTIDVDPVYGIQLHHPPVPLVHQGSGVGSLAEPVPDLLGRLCTGKTLLWRLSGSSMMPVSRPRIFMFWVSLRCRSTTFGYRAGLPFGSAGRSIAGTLERPAPLITCLLLVCGGLRVIPGLCRSHLVIAV